MGVRSKLYTVSEMRRRTDVRTADMDPEPKCSPVFVFMNTIKINTIKDYTSVCHCGSSLAVL